MTIFTIIVTYNAMRRDWIGKCLQCLRTSSYPTVPIVIDNSSTDDTVKYIKQNYPEVVLFPQKKNLGFGQGNNVGIRYALENNADYILLLNQDAYLDEHALERLVKASDGKSMLAPLHLTGDGLMLDRNFKGALYQNTNITLADDALIREKVSELYKIDEVCAACWFIPIDIIKKIGGFNKTFFHYGEDNNFAQRLKYHGIDTFILTTTYMCHDRGEHGSMEAYNNKRVRRDILIVCCNINKSLSGIILGLLKAAVKLYREELPRHNYKIGSFAKELLYVLLHLNIVMQSRNTDRRIGLNWL